MATIHATYKICIFEHIISIHHCNSPQHPQHQIPFSILFIKHLFNVVTMTSLYEQCLSSAAMSCKKNKFYFIHHFQGYFLQLICEHLHLMSVCVKLKSLLHHDKEIPLKKFYVKQNSTSQLLPKVVPELL